MGTLLLKFLLSTNKSGIGSPNWYRNGCSLTSGRLAVYGKIKGILKWLLLKLQKIMTQIYMRLPPGLA